MTMVILGGNQRKAERIARDIVKDLSVADIDFTIAESMGRSGEHRLCGTLDEDFSKEEDRRRLLFRSIVEAGDDQIAEWLGEYETLHISASSTRQQASFLLGYYAALRLFHRSPEVQIVDGGIKERKLRGTSNL
ncbi:MAG: hypothetical protein E6J74_41370 [Deltaproteobacteria bacterium]|nr:MAG: hypothetical protein E6J74_41370 [Deltaproteobacteria bacterium]